MQDETTLRESDRFRQFITALREHQADRIQELRQTRDELTRLIGRRRNGETTTTAHPVKEHDLSMKTLTGLVTVALAIITASCSGSSSNPAAPTPTPPAAAAAATRIIDVSGNLAFGSVNVGSSADRTFSIANKGTATLTYTSLQAVGGTGPQGYTAAPLGGSIPAGGSITVNVHFAPPSAGFFSNVLTVIGDQTSGNAAINASGNGVAVAPPAPPFTRSGTGATVFDVPTTVTRIRVFADYPGNCENFAVRIAGRLLVNEILGSCSVATSAHHFDGTFLTSGGVAEILQAIGVSWTLVQVN